jgi:hypothetical protein
MSEEKNFLNHWSQKTALLAAPTTALAVTLGVCAGIDDGHTHNENRVPIEITVNSMSASGTNTASATLGLTQETFQTWAHGGAFWQVESRPDLVLVIGDPPAGAPIITSGPRRT